MTRAQVEAVLAAMYFRYAEPDDDLSLEEFLGVFFGLAEELGIAEKELCACD
jgi:hypothetical protein